jgi:sugar/nucleoside kinase (ribokinase family)
VTVVVVGDANVDLEVRLPALDGAPSPPQQQPHLSGGGSAANTAAALARLGVPCRFVGTVGDDAFGRFATAALGDAGVDTAALTTSADDPTVVVIVVVPPGGDRLIYVWPAQGGAHGALEPEAAIAAARGASWLHVSGICLRVSPAREALLAVMEGGRASGIPVSLDLNLRLENWGWDDGFRDAVEAAVERADVVLGSAREEVGALAGVDDPAAAAEALAGASRLVVARTGEEGAVACGRGSVVAEPAFPVVAVDTVGAGDAFNAGFIAARLAGDDVASAVRRGNAVAALTIARPGARTTPTAAEVDRLLGRRRRPA